ncbi:MAG: hypothetical protein L6Q84_05125 [Polyangiaceae bacterium]|nr:hypothetical protein [Polyangiaceae bacterium]
MRRVIPIVSVMCAAAAGLLVGARPGSAQEASRYPYDPVCPWGRLSNGKGMLVRCIAEGEARALPEKGTSPPPPAAPSASAPPAPSASADPPPADPLKAFALRGITVTADEGKLPAAEKKLAQGKDKILECVGKHGGLEKNEGEAHVRFLVSARGRAEGVSVKKRVGMSAAAADCIAHVVDRRWVGEPPAPMVGGTAVIRVGKQKS